MSDEQIPDRDELEADPEDDADGGDADASGPVFKGGPG